MAIINNFRLVDDKVEMPPYLSEFDIVEGLQVYKSSFNPSLLVIHDKEKEIYRCIEYTLMNPFNEDDIKAYIKVYKSDKNK